MVSTGKFPILAHFQELQRWAGRLVLEGNESPIPCGWSQGHEDFTQVADGGGIRVDFNLGLPLLSRWNLVEKNGTLGRRVDVFRGNAPARVDDKGRLKIPNAFRALM